MLAVLNVPNVMLVKQQLELMVLVHRAMLVNTVIQQWNRPPVLCVPLVGMLKKGAPNAKPAKLEKQRTVISLAIPAKIVMLVNTVRAA